MAERYINPYDEIAHNFISQKFKNNRVCRSSTLDIYGLTAVEAISPKSRLQLLFLFKAMLLCILWISIDIAQYYQLQ